ncbi:MAG TPA: hypothetical protein RMH99_02535 [Sandaracinaceae bacterium LLY-WYZ-13_1]|nr:hypothetical protein [Sandaracinaceae bacterium LLY-WYZ-13_1]
MAPDALRRVASAHRIEDAREGRRRSDALRERAAAHREEGRWLDAERVLQHAFVLAPTNPHVSRELAELYLARGRAALALPWAERAARLRRRRPTYRLLVGDVLEALGRSGAARAAWREALRLDPTHRAARQRLRD